MKENRFTGIRFVRQFGKLKIQLFDMKTRKTIAEKEVGRFDACWMIKELAKEIH